MKVWTTVCVNDCKSANKDTSILDNNGVECHVEELVQDFLCKEFD